MEITIAILIISLAYLWPALLAELFLFKLKKQREILFRIKLYLISYASWLLFGFGVLLLTYFTESMAFDYLQKCESSINGCNRIILEVSQFIYEWGKYLFHIPAFISAWYLLNRQKQSPNKLLKTDRQKQASV